MLSLVVRRYGNLVNGSGCQVSVFTCVVYVHNGLSRIYIRSMIAEVGRRTVKALQAVLKRSFEERSKSVTYKVSALPAPSEVQVSQRQRHRRRDHSRGFKNAIKDHYREISVFIGTLFSSLRDFRLANAVLSMESADARDRAGHHRRHRLKYAEISFPRFDDSPVV